MATVALEPNIRQSGFRCWETQPDLPEQSNLPVTDEFEDLYMTYRSRVWALCLRMTGNPDEAEDLTQETFVRLFQKLSTFRGESAFCTWLRRIAINVVLLRFQKASWRREKSIEELSHPDPVTGHPNKMEFSTVDTQLAEAVDRVSLQRAIDQLPPGFKAVLILHDIEGYEHIEISKLMGFSVGTSKSQLHKARLKMRELLAHAPHEEPSPSRPEADRTPLSCGSRLCSFRARCIKAAQSPLLKRRSRIKCPHLQRTMGALNVEAVMLRPRPRPQVG